MSNLNPKYSIIVPHYQGSISHEVFLRGINSLLNQTFKDFEIICYHDGPLLDSSVEFPIDITPTDKRYNDFGHSLRDIGLKESRGKYILHFNPDNILYDFALENINISNSPITIFPINMIGLTRAIIEGVTYVFYDKIRDTSKSCILSGNPPILNNIDCMQLVMERDIWINEGGWYDKSEQGDGIMYEKLCNKYDVRYLDKVLGEHW